jgi:sugar (pentulose or hexulose) kinase
MVHCSNCTSDFNAWAGLFTEFAHMVGADISEGKVMDLFFEKALDAKPDCDGIVAYNYYSGEANVGLTKGVPVLMRKPGADFSFANFARTHLYTCLSTLKMGLDILIREENIKIDRICGHGGYFKTPEVGQRLLSAASASPVSLMESAGEGGPYGMALLAAFTATKKEGESLEEYLEKRVFKNARSLTLTATDDEIAGFEKFLERYKKGLDIEKCAIKSL